MQILEIDSTHTQINATVIHGERKVRPCNKWKTREEEESKAATQMVKDLLHTYVRTYTDHQ